MSFLITKGLALLLSCMIFLNAYFIKSYAKTWLFPSCMFSLFLFAYTFSPLIALINVPINPYAILYILACSIIFSCSSFSFDWEKAFKANSTKLNLGGANVFDTRFLKIVFVMSQLYVLVSIVINIHINGLTISNYFNNFFQTTKIYLEKRYSGVIITNIFFQMGIICNFLGVTLGGLLVSLYKKKMNIIILLTLSFLPSILFMLLYADKGTLFLAIVLFYGGVLINRIHNNDFSLTTPKTNKVVLIASLVIIPLVILSFMMRVLYVLQSDEILFALINYFISYAFGHIYAFSDWFSYYFFHDSLIKTYDGHPSTLGFYTFMVIFKIFNSSLTTPPGLYGEYFTYQHVLTTNIYTIFRGLILDYGLMGSLIFCYLAGLFFNGSYYRMLITKSPVISISLFILMIAAFYSSYMVSILMWGSIYAFCALLTLVLFFNKIGYDAKHLH